MKILKLAFLDENSDPIDFEEIICRNNYIAQNNQTNFILLNSQLDIYAFKLSANIILDFYGLWFFIFI